MDRILRALILLSSIAIGCSNAAPTGGIDSEFTTQDGAKFKVETIATGLEVPWAFAWMPNGDMLFTERPGRNVEVDRRLFVVAHRDHLEPAVPGFGVADHHPMAAADRDRDDRTGRERRKDPITRALLSVALPIFL